MNSESAIETFSGRFVDLLDPHFEDLDLEDIAVVLSREPRFGGHTVGSEIFSVAQHSIFVMHLVQLILEPGSEQNERFMCTVDSVSKDLYHNDENHKIFLKHALLHDASEAYLRDIPTPIKNIQPFGAHYRAIEEKLMLAINEKFVFFDARIANEKDEKDAIDAIVSAASTLTKWADRYALAIEAYHLVSGRGRNWQTPQMSLSYKEKQLNSIWTPLKSAAEDFVYAYWYVQNR